MALQVFDMFNLFGGAGYVRMEWDDVSQEMTRFIYCNLTGRTLTWQATAGGGQVFNRTVGAGGAEVSEPPGRQFQIGSRMQGDDETPRVNLRVS